MTYGSDMKDYEADQNQIIKQEIIPMSGWYEFQFTKADISNKPGLIQCTICKGKTLIGKSSLENFQCICQQIEKWPATTHRVCKPNGHHNFSNVGMEFNPQCPACAEARRRPIEDIQKKMAVKRAEIDVVKRKMKQKKKDARQKIEDEQKAKEKQERIEEQAEAYFIALKKLEDSKFVW